MTRHATPEQWAKMEQSADSYGTCSCLLELRDRIAALENAANHSVEAPKMVPAPAGGLVERVAIAIDDAPYDESLHQWDEARAAILAVAKWLEREGIQAWAADRLREEVERG